MLIKVTNKCSMGCTHCLEDSTPAGEDMSWDTFVASVEFTERVENYAWATGVTPFILLSGGEPSENPLIDKFIELVISKNIIPILITNGMWLEDKELRERILRPEWPKLTIQVTNDSRFYPTGPKIRVDDPRVGYVSKISSIIPLGRIKKRMPEEPKARRSPTSFNLRSLTQSFKSFDMAVFVIRRNAAMGKSGNCIPSICSSGDVVAGESRLCYKIGTVWSTTQQITQTLLEMGSCNRCGLETGLSTEERSAIGL
jgi:hypothetical protein